MGAEGGMEVSLVPAEIPMHCIAVTGLRGKGRWAWMTAPYRLIKACWQAAWILLRVKPDLVVGMGGFASGPGGLMAYCLRKKILIHEQNAVAGLTNRCLSHIATRVLQAFPNAFPQARCAQTVGNPVRAALHGLPAPEKRYAGRCLPLRVLVIGGSRGAHAINRLLMDWAEQAGAGSDIMVWHQTGQADYLACEQAYASAGVSATVMPFIEDMASAYAWADWVICRAGALTVSELAVVGLPSLLIPFPAAVDDHQYHNAAYLSQVGAAVVMRQASCQVADLVACLAEYASPEGLDKLAQMAYQARQAAADDAVDKMLSHCLALLEEEKRL
jgi:UDP-N-acetylglucosamine--N-acetylmuramyl-(pentapeptide) pyrophosphoryl-undecaprenol N-acetylglucosamine transferase